MEKYIAHKTEDKREQTLLEHSNQTAAITKQNAVEMVQEIAYALGLAHDLGKYSETFQDRIQNDAKVRYEHSLGGALEYRRLMQSKKISSVVAALMMYCIAGHHTGLPDGGTKDDNPDDDHTLQARLKKEKNLTGKGAYQDFHKELSLVLPETDRIVQELGMAYQDSKEEFVERFAFFTRYLFSCLTDADYLDTEAFFNPGINRNLRSDLQSSEFAVRKLLDGFTATTELQKARSRLQAQAFKNAESFHGIGSLPMPVGSGKTLCSFEIALKRALAEEKKRIIYVIPYTSIIEQTANIFTKLVGDTTDVLQHHSNFAFEEDSENDTETMRKLKLASENWNAPIIVTTNVQFFESMYHYRGSKLRKLHNLADSVIVFDEIHMLPVNMLQPCFRALGYISKYLNSEILLLSATMPDYEKFVQKYIPDIPIVPLITDFSDYGYFKKCKYHNLGLTDLCALADQTNTLENSLIIANTRKTVKTLYEMLEGKKYHLSTYMTPYDRTETIRKIKEDLSAHRHITVVSTSLIEAGVDVDFVSVFREITGMDSILQSAGRCNREGNLEYGNVYLFKLDSYQRPPSRITSELIEKYQDIESPECIKEYYNRLFAENAKEIEENNIAARSNVSGTFISIPFTSYANQFQLIQEETTSVIINLYPETPSLIAKFKHGNFTAKRKLQQYSVSLKQKELESALQDGIVEQEDNLFIVNNPAFYSHETGIRLETEPATE